MSDVRDLTIECEEKGKSAAMRLIERCLLSVVPCLLCSAVGLAGQNLSSVSVVATVGDVKITEADIDARLGDRLFRVKTELNNLRQAELDVYVEGLLLSREAAARGIGLETLIQTEVDGHISPVTEVEASAVIEAAPAGYRALSGTDALKAAAQNIERGRTAVRRKAVIESLRAKYGVEILLDPPRASRRLTDGESNGPEAAPVSIVVFSDFQCPYCGSLARVLDRIRSEYVAEVRIVFKHFPLPIHPQAAIAAEAALCGGSQGRFWEMHDALFAEQKVVAAGNFEELARRSGLDMAVFNRCMSLHELAGKLDKDREEARSAGVTGTPTMFINGQMIVGAKSHESLKDLIERELNRVAIQNRGSDRGR